jgi:hypothetical protein
VSPTAAATAENTDAPVVEEIVEPVEELAFEHGVSLDLDLSEAEALRTWLMKPAQDGSTSLDEPLVSRALTKLAMSIDTVLATVNVRRELEDAGLAVEHLSDEQVCELGRRVAQAANPSYRH